MSSGGGNSSSKKANKRAREAIDKSYAWNRLSTAFRYEQDTINSYYSKLNNELSGLVQNIQNREARENNLQQLEIQGQSQLDAFLKNASAVERQLESNKVGYDVAKRGIEDVFSERLLDIGFRKEQAQLAFDAQKSRSQYQKDSLLQQQEGNIGGINLQVLNSKLRQRQTAFDSDLRVKGAKAGIGKTKGDLQIAKKGFGRDVKKTRGDSQSNLRSLKRDAKRLDGRINRQIELAKGKTGKARRDAQRKLDSLKQQRSLLTKNLEAETALFEKSKSTVKDTLASERESINLDKTNTRQSLNQTLRQLGIDSSQLSSNAKSAISDLNLDKRQVSSDLSALLKDLNLDRRKVGSDLSQRLTELRVQKQDVEFNKDLVRLDKLNLGLDRASLDLQEDKLRSDTELSIRRAEADIQTSAALQQNSVAAIELQKDKANLDASYQSTLQEVNRIRESGQAKARGQVGVSIARAVGAIDNLSNVNQQYIADSLTNTTQNLNLQKRSINERFNQEQRTLRFGIDQARSDLRFGLDSLNISRGRADIAEGKLDTSLEKLDLQSGLIDTRASKARTDAGFARERLSDRAAKARSDARTSTDQLNLRISKTRSDLKRGQQSIDVKRDTARTTASNRLSQLDNRSEQLGIRAGQQIAELTSAQTIRGNRFNFETGQLTRNELQTAEDLNDIIAELGVNIKDLQSDKTYTAAKLAEDIRSAQRDKGYQLDLVQQRKVQAIADANFTTKEFRRLITAANKTKQFSNRNENNLRSKLENDKAVTRAQTKTAIKDIESRLGVSLAELDLTNRQLGESILSANTAMTRELQGLAREKDQADISAYAAKMANPFLVDPGSPAFRSIESFIGDVPRPLAPIKGASQVSPTSSPSTAQQIGTGLATVGSVAGTASGLMAMAPAGTAMAAAAPGVGWAALGLTALGTGLGMFG